MAHEGRRPPVLPVVEPAAVVRGAGVAVAVCLPLAVVAAIVVDPDDPSDWAFPLYAATLVGLVAGGWVASGAGTSPLVTGALAGLAAYAVVQAVGVVLRLARGDAVHWASILFTAALAYGCGLTGAVLAERRRRRRGQGAAG